MTETPAPPVFDAGFRQTLEDLLLWRRDVRHFRTDPLPPGALDDLIRLTCLSPSVGNSQPWRFVTVEDPARRAAVRQSFLTANAEALADYHGERARMYAGLKLTGLDRAPVQMAVFCDTDPAAGYGLGRRTMPQTLHYSVAGAIMALFLVARARGIGVGIVSIIDPAEVKAALDVPQSWDLVAYLCIGYPEADHNVPELVRTGWQDRLSPADLTLRR